MKKRLISMVVAVSLIFVCAIGRVGWIMFSGNYTVSSTYNSYTLTLDKLYPTIYDCNFNRLTNNNSGYVAVIRPNEKSMSELELLFSKEEISEVTDELSLGYPVVRAINNYSTCKYINVVDVLIDDPSSKNILIKTMQNKLNVSIGEKTINFTVDARGRLLDGDEGTINSENYNSNAGIALTIDMSVQKAVMDAAKNMKKGAVVVMDVENSNVLAAYSAPDDYIDRCLSSYSVGSVFKLIVSAAALENNVETEYNCSGSITVGDTTFSCQNNRAHGNQGMKEALANSCNCYFIDLALNLGAADLNKTAQKFGFGGICQLYDDWNVSNGNLPTVSDLKSKGQLALLGFGQGSLTSTPLQFASSICTIADGGIYRSPNLVLGSITENNELIENSSTKQMRVISEETSEKLREYMRYVVTNGTASRADYNNNSAGKTSTAQSGRFVDNKEILNTWFAGFYPYNRPKYAIVVMTEDGTSGAGDCCPVFRTIVENLGN